MFVVKVNNSGRNKKRKVSNATSRKGKFTRGSRKIPHVD